MSTTTTTTTATPTKLRSGEWGAKIRGRVREGQTITITARSGKSWPARVAKIVWQGDGVAICATESQRPDSHRRPNYSGGWCNCGACEDLLSMGYGHMAGQTITCPECGKRAEVC